MPAGPHDTAAFGEAELRVDRIEMAVGHELRADIRRAFFAGFGEQDDVAIERHVLPLQHQHQHDAGHEVVLVIDGAASIYVAAFADRAERRMRPLGGIDGHHVGVAHDQDWTLLAVALDARDEVGARRHLREHLVWNPFLVEYLLEIFDRPRLIARRAAGVELQQCLEMLDGFGFDGGVAGLLRAGNFRHGNDEQCGQETRGHFHRAKMISPGCLDAWRPDNLNSSCPW